MQEVKVLCGPRRAEPPVRARVSLARANLKEADGQITDTTNRNRIQGRRGGVSEHWIAMPDTRPDARVGKSGGDREKDGKLTLGDPRECRDDPGYCLGDEAGESRGSQQRP